MNILERHTLELIGENTASPDVFTDDDIGMTQIRDSLNDAIEEICMLTGSYKENYYLQLKEDQNFYRLSFSRGEFAWVTDAWLHNQGRRLEQTDLIRLEYFNHRWMLNIGTPYSYFQVGLKYIGIWPYPASDGDILQLTCVSIPERYSTSTDRIRLRDDYKWASVHFAVGEYFASRGDAKSAVYHHQKYMERLGIRLIEPMAAEYKPYYKTNKEYWPKSTD